jgi:hypothetical protein
VFLGASRQSRGAPRQAVLDHSTQNRRRVVTQAGERIVQLYQSWGKPEKAAEWGAKLRLPGNGQIH